MTDTRDVAYVRKRLCNASDLMSEVFVRVEDISEENKKLKELLKDCNQILIAYEMMARGGYRKKLNELISKINQVLQETH